MAERNYNNKENMYGIMDTTQSNYSNMLKRLHIQKTFSNFIITYYSIALIVYSLTAEFFESIFDVKLASYFNIILSIVVLTYSLIITNAKYSERIQAAEKIMNEVKAKKRELDDQNVQQIRQEYENIVSKAEYRSDIDFFRTLKQRCKKANVRWYCYKNDLLKLKMENEKEAEKLNDYLGENFPKTQQIKIIIDYIWKGMVLITPVALFIICFVVEIS